MRTRAVLGSILTSTVVLVVGWQAGGATLAQRGPPTSATATQTTSTVAAPATRAPSAAPGSPAAGAPNTSAGTPTSAAPAPVASTPADGNYTGTSVQTEYGSVQVAVTVSSGTVTDVTAVHLTNADGRSVQISNRAAPILQQEVITSQSARVSNVSGATYTSEAYARSVQSALDQAGF